MKGGQYEVPPFAGLLPDDWTAVQQLLNHRPRKPRRVLRAAQQRPNRRNKRKAIVRLVDNPALGN